ncbi:MAG: hypothetical protein AMXMBFR33_73200 [Candidatus Xenobia bacterium]
MVLLLTDSLEHPVLRQVGRELEGLGAGYQVCRSDEFPRFQKLSVHCGQRTDAWIEGAGATIDFEQLRSIWVHRFVPGAPAPDLDPSLVALSVTTCRAALADALEALPEVLCLNSISAASLAASRLRQVQLACQAGLAVPETLISNSAEVADQFLASYGDAVVRWVLPSLPSQPPGPGPHRAQLLTREHLSVESHDFQSVPRLIQRLIPKQRDLRCLYLAGQIFCASLSDPTAGAPDWRRTSARPWVASQVDHETTEAIGRLMEGLGLQLATVDLADDGQQLYFLDVNPFGEWFWMEQQAHLPISGTLARVLAE